MRKKGKFNEIMGGWLPKIIFGIDFRITLIASLLIAILWNENVLREASVNIGIAEVTIGTALLGIVLAGLAILVAFLDEKYIMLLQKVPPGFEADIWPFKITAFVAIMCAVFGMLLIIIGKPPDWLFRTIIFFSLWSFSYLLWGMFDLISFVAGHARNRMEQLSHKDTT